MRYKKYYTVKQWKKFDKWAERENGTDYTFQEVLLRKYEIILTDHQTKSEKVKKILDKFTIQNLDRSMTKFAKGIDKFAKSMESSQNKRKRTRKSKRSRIQTKEPDYSALFFGSKKTRNTKKSKEPDYSALIGGKKKKVKMF